jgi:hypothetical protein
MLRTIAMLLLAGTALAGTYNPSTYAGRLGSYRTATHPRGFAAEPGPPPDTTAPVVTFIVASCLGEDLQRVFSTTDEDAVVQVRTCWQAGAGHPADKWFGTWSAFSGTYTTARNYDRTDTLPTGMYWHVELRAKDAAENVSAAAWSTFQAGSPGDCD